MKHGNRLSSEDIARIGASIYRGVTYNGAPAWQSWLADGLSVDAATVRRWLMDGAPSHRCVPTPIARLLLAAERIAEQLEMWMLPRGTLIVDRMAEIASCHAPTLRSTLGNDSVRESEAKIAP
jgi:hypothetical protein